MLNFKNLKIVLSFILITGLSLSPADSLAQSQSGDEWLNKMADAIIESGTEVSTITTNINQTIMSPMGEVAVTGVTTYNFDNGNQRAELETPQGKVEIIIEDGEGMQRMGGQEIPMNDAQLAQVKTEAERNYVNIALNKNDYDAEFKGMETVDNTQHAMIEIGLTVPVTYYINTETALPTKITYAQFNQQNGQEIDVEVQYSDWQTVSGVTYAYKTETFANGQKASSGTFSELKVN
jgi:hypothetical protein